MDEMADEKFQQWLKKTGPKDNKDNQNIEYSSIIIGAKHRSKDLSYQKKNEQQSIIYGLDSLKMREKILNEIVEIVENKQRQDFVLLPDPDKEINTGL